MQKEAVKQAEKEAKKAAREAKSAARNADKKTKPASNGEKKPRQQKSDEEKKATGKMSDTSGVKKPPRFIKNPKKPVTKEQEEFADANAQAFLKMLEAEEKAKADLKEQQESAVATNEEPLLLVGGEQMPEITGELDARDIDQPHRLLKPQLRLFLRVFILLLLMSRSRPKSRKCPKMILRCCTPRPLS